MKEGQLCEDMHQYDRDNMLEYIESLVHNYQFESDLRTPFASDIGPTV